MDTVYPTDEELIVETKDKLRPIIFQDSYMDDPKNNIYLKLALQDRANTVNTIDSSK